MESDYDRKFEDMKKYIPFLESMIKRLESTSSLSSNPRQAQLDKIRSLRDLLLDKKKRMKMENLLKCEQVLINLYAKVEQRDTLPITKKSANSSVSDSSRMDNNSQLEIVRNKLKRVSKIQDGVDTLPEIVRASDVEDVCMSGSVEPALFQRRPHKKSPTLSDISSSSQEKPNSPEVNSKRKYTRVLYSPEPNSRPRSVSQDSSSGAALFSRRSPKKSLPPHNIKEGKKANKHQTSKETKDLNITLKVPEESLNSLNTKDILSRIITCNDNDVDIETLRGLRTQILCELKQTGANDDISDLILKSYAGTKTTTKVKDDVEEGELSDSESEVIESIYGSLILVDKDNTNNEVKSIPEKDQPRKIQICLVINPKDSESSTKISKKPNQDSKEDLQLTNEKESKITTSKVEEIMKAIKSTCSFENTSDEVIIAEDDNCANDHSKKILKANTKVAETDSNRATSMTVKPLDQTIEKNETDKDITSNKRNNKIFDKKEANVIIKEDEQTKKANNTDADNSKASSNLNESAGSLESPKKNEQKSDAAIQFKANFYKPLLDEENAGPSERTSVNKKDSCPLQLEKPKIPAIDIPTMSQNECVKIPLLDEPIISVKPVEKDIDSQIDILQALKNEILGDNILSKPRLDVVTPPLHQPKLTKLLQTQAIVPKKRISIEKYKEKTAPVPLSTSISGDTVLLSPKDDSVKKQSLKLTEKECERFFPAKIDITDDVSSEDEDQKKSKIPITDVYDNFAPKSPDHDDTHFVEKTQPVIIPIDPVKGSVANFKADVDMRTLPLLSPKVIPAMSSAVSTSHSQNSKEINKNDTKLDIRVDTPSRNHSPLIDPRMNRDSNYHSKIDSCSLTAMNLEKNFTSCMTPNSRSYELTPSRSNDYDVVSASRNHVYTPSYSSFDSRDSIDQSVSNDACSLRDSEIGTIRRKSRWEEYNDHDSRSNFSPIDNNAQRSKYAESYKSDINTGKKCDRSVSDKNDDSVRGHSPMTPLPIFGWSEGSSKPSSFSRSEGPVPLMMLKFGRPECPSTPSHPFGRSDCPPTHGHPFTRLDMPGTPSHPFGRTDCPLTPVHPFGRNDCPTTPVHPFGRSDCPPTPSHSFGRSDVPPLASNHMLGRSDCPSTPSHPFGRIDCPPPLSSPFGRMEFPGTPNHSFGMSECPTTPNHPFGRSDCPSTPSHSFGRLECPPTPSHPFGISECPTTPNHSFGRADGGMTPNYSFGRTEQTQNISITQPYSKDPRLNRRSESRSQRDNRNFKDRSCNTGNSYQNQNRHFNRSEPERSRSMSRNEKNFGRTNSRENCIDQSNTAVNRSSYISDNRSRDRERSTEDRNPQEKSVGRNQENLARSHPRASSINRNDNKQTEKDNTLSFKSYAGRSFTIDTSVNSTFQDLLKRKGWEIRDQSFDSRKQRAASVGRSIGLCLADDGISKNISGDSVAADSKHGSKNYRRASSVGRDLLDKHDSFQSVKVDLKNYQSKLAKKDEKPRHSKSATEEGQKIKKCSDNKNVKSAHITKKTDKTTYSPRKNSRDPRMRREYDDKNRHRGSGHSSDKHNHEINYSSDNLTRGAILKSGYGVKNYKIPKIKRITNENQDDVKLIEEKIDHIETKIKKDTSTVSANKNKKHTPGEDVKTGSSGKRPSRSSKKDKNVAGAAKKDRVGHRKPKRLIIYDSSSDTETTDKETAGSNILSSDDDKPIKYTEPNKNKQSIQESAENCDTQKSEKVSENIVVKSVMDNVKTRISDTIQSPISDSGTETIEDAKYTTPEDDKSNMCSIENINISNRDTTGGLFNKDIDGKSKVIDVTRDNHDKTEKVASDVNTVPKALPSYLDETNDKSPVISPETNSIDANINQVHNSKHHVDTHPSVTNSITKQIDNKGASRNAEDNMTNINLDAIVSTTNNDKETKNVQEEIAESTESNDVNYETSAADSTNEVTSDKVNIRSHIIPDSTIDAQSDMNSLVTSTLNSTDVPIKDFIEPNFARTDKVPPLDSIGSLLSILQDKSKIHQLLSMIGESGDNDKIKRKLEKLSEIVSDDEEPFDKIDDSKAANDTNKDDVDHKADIQVNVQSYEKVTDTKLENVEQNVDDTINAEKGAGETVISDDKERRDVPKINTVKKSKGSKKSKRRFSKAKKTQHVTRAAVGKIEKIPVVKKPSRELIKLREDIKEMFLTDEMLNSTGIRMCRLAKLVDEKSSNRKEDTPQETKPVVVIEKCKDHEKSEEAAVVEKPTKKKISSKIKRNTTASQNLTNEENKTTNTKPKSVLKYFIVPKSKNKDTKQEYKDPYEYESDSLDTGTIKGSDSEEVSDSETNSLASSQSFGSTEVLADLQKKTKRKRRGKAWQTGIIKPKNKKKKIKMTEPSMDEEPVHTQKNTPDSECFIDKFYCFERNVSTYSCRLCEYTGDDIIIHYRKQHPHTEIPLSRMNPVIAKEAVEQCQEVNFPAISKISTDKYVCRFCFKEFSKTKTVLETFFWHVVSMHTGEYKQTCSECVNNTCYFNLDIPPPPKDNLGQLIGYLCGKCNFTQVSLENLKTHVIGRHNDEQTDVYTINLAAMTKKTLKALAKHQSQTVPRVLRSLRSNQRLCEGPEDENEMPDDQNEMPDDQNEMHDDQNEMMVENPIVDDSVSQNETKLMAIKIEKKTQFSSMQTKIAFESEEMMIESESGQKDHNNQIEIKQESIETEDPSQSFNHGESEVGKKSKVQPDSSIERTQLALPDDILAHAHFKISYKKSGAKEYVCCINGNENHYKTTLLISMKKHLQTKHAESWDGYCVLCKVIVMPQGLHNFRDCLQHFLDKHMDEFPVLDIPTEVCNDNSPAKLSSDVDDILKPYINVRPMNQLIFNNIENNVTNDTTIQFPKIESVVSLGASVSLPQSSPTYPPVLCTEMPEEKQYRYEEWQAEVMSKKHRVVLNAMMSEEKLVKVFKCTGRFCSFTTDNAENALVHATTHERIGGEGALNCSYCDFDASNNGIDLVMHVFKAHGKTPYACKLCFYRSTSGQLVSSHVSRLHSERQSFDSILHSTTVAAPVADDHDLMSREQAVPYYVCGYPTSEGENSKCKYKTFTPGQFVEHLARHRPPYPCNMCQTSSNTVSDLVHHMKTHGLRLYQCTFCVFGASNETEMLAHASSRHPDKLPQTYLRVVTNKDGSTELRVLPRAFLNKAKPPSRDVMSGDTDNPVREAERSLALEKLIGHTESSTSIEPIETKKVADHDDISADMGIVEDSEQLLAENIEQELVPPIPATPERSSRRKSNVVVSATEVTNKRPEENANAVVKTEPPADAPKVSTDSVVYCLDSDEEETRPRVIDISDDDIASTSTASTKKSKTQQTSEYIKVPLDKLFICPKCRGTNRNLSGFKRHTNTCLAFLSLPTYHIQCPHEKCTKQLNSGAQVAEHYFRDHADRKVTIFACGICKAKFKSAPLTKKHMRELHKSGNFVVNPPETMQGDNKIYTITDSVQAAKVTRKSSSEAGKQQKRYGPQDIDQLPINPILDSLVYCSLCEFNTKVRLNMVRHLQLHAEQQPVPQTAPVNPVPHLETNERHFDKMVNLASSSIVNRPPDKANKVDVLPTIPAHEIGRYPKYVPDRMRYTCGTKNCSYISVDEAMLRIHWETLHSNTNDYLCVHCPPHQYLDQTKPLTAARIIGHLKMHEGDLYACSICCYYHFKRVAVEKHLQKCPQMHKDGHVLVVREGGVTPTSAPAPIVTAPSMDLKPWQCGLCSFKSMLRPEVADHCFKLHQSKMQYKCSYCPFRTSALENVTKHQANAHSDKVEDVFYYYYREGSIPDDDDGTPRWLRQKKGSGVTELVVKAEILEPSTSQCDLATITPTPVAVNLNLVKQEIEDPELTNSEENIEDLCKRFGGFCEPNGLKYKCPLCTAVIEDTSEAMQSHLYEELKYRKWGCSVCSYKAFHKTGLNKHIKSEHRMQFQEPIELPTDVNVEKWVAGLLEYQTELITRNKQNKQVDETPSTSKDSPENGGFHELVRAFGSLGTPRDGLFCCPKCNGTHKDERAMKEHLEIELTKIRWCCSNCSFMSQTYHESQFHCKSIHPGESATPREALRSADKRADWVDAVIRTQKRAIIIPSPDDTVGDKLTDMYDPSDNSLLVVRYEERVPPTPEDATSRRKRSSTADSDEEKLVIDESDTSSKKKSCKQRYCSFCDFKTKWANALREHLLRHYNLKPFICRYCDFPGYRPMIVRHIEKSHPGLTISMTSTPIPKEPPSVLVLPKYHWRKASTTEEAVGDICLYCGQTVTEKDMANHTHGENSMEFAKRGDVVVKCCICLVLRLDVTSLHEHHKACHPSEPVNYAYFKLHCDTLECYYCSHCSNRFSYLRDLRSHHKAMHSGLTLKYTMGFPMATAAEESNAKRKNEDNSIEPSPKRVARKSTTKLPHNAVAKKSTTKLPRSVDNVDKDVEEFSYYGTKPQSLDSYANVTTLMPFCNTMVPFTVKKLSEIIKIEPVVLVDDGSN